MTPLLLPLSCLYGLGVRLRNALFDMGLLKSRSYAVPVIGVGNITVGGTGKTPHTEYLIRLLQTHGYRVAVLSRGYRRKSRGYVLATPDTPMEQIGDEPWQMKHKFPGAHVAVDADRCHGIHRLTTDEATRDVDVILLDDAYQHRHVHPGLNILLVDSNRPLHTDRLLPAGRLREPASGKRRADMVIVTKCPAGMSPIDFRVMQDQLGLQPYQRLYFSTMVYGALLPILDTPGGERPLSALRPEEHILLLTGIAQPQPLLRDLHLHSCNVTPLSYPDHHNFTPADAERINQAFDALPQPRLVITTEKDASRLATLAGLSDEVRHAIYALPVEPHLLRDMQASFNEKILSYVHKNSRNSILAQKPPHQPARHGHHPGHGAG